MRQPRSSARDATPPGRRRTGEIPIFAPRGGGRGPYPAGPLARLALEVARQRLTPCVEASARRWRARAPRAASCATEVAEQALVAPAGDSRRGALADSASPRRARGLRVPSRRRHARRRRPRLFATKNSRRRPRSACARAASQRRRPRLGASTALRRSRRSDRDAQAQRARVRSCARSNDDHRSALTTRERAAMPRLRHHESAGQLRESLTLVVKNQRLRDEDPRSVRATLVDRASLGGPLVSPERSISRGPRSGAERADAARCPDRRRRLHPPSASATRWRSCRSTPTACTPWRALIVATVQHDVTGLSGSMRSLTRHTGSALRRCSGPQHAVLLRTYIRPRATGRGSEDQTVNLDGTR